MVKTAQSAAAKGASAPRELQTTGLTRAHKLLLIDTDSKSSSLLQTGLNDAGYHVALATDVESALDHLERSQTDLILTHTRLPDMVGFQLVEEVRKDPKWSHIPVLLLSGDLRLSGPEGRPEVEDYLIKPLDLKDVLARVQVVTRSLPRPEVAQEPEPQARASDSITIPRGFDPLEPVTGTSSAPLPDAPAVAAGSDAAATSEYVAGASVAPAEGSFRTLDYALRDDHAARVTWAPKGRKRRKHGQPGRTLRGVAEESRPLDAGAPAKSAAQPTDAAAATSHESGDMVAANPSAPRISASEIPESTVQERSAWVTGTQDVPTLVPSAEPPSPDEEVGREARHESDIHVKDDAEPTRGADRPTLAVASMAPEDAVAALDAAAQTRALMEGARAELGLTVVDSGSPDPQIMKLEAPAPQEARRRPADAPRDAVMSAFPLLLSDLPEDAPISIVPFPSDLRLLRDPRLRNHSPFPPDPRVPSDPRAVLSQPPLLASEPPVTDSMLVPDELTRSKPVLPPNPRIPSNPVLPPNPRVPSNPAGRPSTAANAKAEDAPAAASTSARGKRKRRRLKSLGFSTTLASRPLSEELPSREEQPTPAHGVPMPLLEQEAVVKQRPELNNLATVRPPPGLMLQIPMNALRSLPPEGEDDSEPKRAERTPQKQRKSAPIIVTLDGDAGQHGSDDPSDALLLPSQGMPRPERELLATVRPSAIHTPPSMREPPGAMVRVSTTWSGSPPPRTELEPVQAQARTQPHEPKLRLPEEHSPLPSTMPPHAYNASFWTNVVLGAVAVALVVLLGVLLAQRASHKTPSHQRLSDAAPAAQPVPSHPGSTASP